MLLWSILIVIDNRKQALPGLLHDLSSFVVAGYEWQSLFYAKTYYTSCARQEIMFSYPSHITLTNSFVEDAKF